MNILYFAIALFFYFILYYGLLFSRGKKMQKLAKELNLQYTQTGEKTRFFYLGGRIERNIINGFYNGISFNIKDTYYSPGRRASGATIINGKEYKSFPFGLLSVDKIKRLIQTGNIDN